jgi:pro-apoptotic serine protease NMA111
LILESVAHCPVPTLEAFIEVMKTLPDRARVTVTARDIRDTHILQTYVIQLERHWSSEFKLWVRNDKTGLWDPTDLGPAPPPKEWTPKTARFVELAPAMGPAVDLVRCFVRVSYYMPVRVRKIAVSELWGLIFFVDRWVSEEQEDGECNDCGCGEGAWGG